MRKDIQMIKKANDIIKMENQRVNMLQDKLEDTTY